MNLQELRAKHPKLIYRSFSWELLDNDLEIKANFLLEPDTSFQAKVIVHGVKQEQIDQLGQKQLDVLAFHLGLAELPSYWKAACSPVIEIQAGNLSDAQKKWWLDLLIKGLGEFFFVNQIDFTQTDFLKIETPDQSQPVTSELIQLSNEPQFSSVKTTSTSYSAHSAYQTDGSADTSSQLNYLVPVGGGKDSALTLALLEKNHLPYSILLLQPHSPAATKIAANSQAQQTIQAERYIDPKLLELNKAGYLNGHTPFSSYLAFLSSCVAQLFGHSQILLSNESSANEGNAKFHGQIVNHQYSKTLEFETAFRQYAAQFLGTPEYVSWLRPLHELQIAMLFSQFSEYHPDFRSCNVGQRQNAWCGHCPKCLFVFAMMSPFIDESILSNKIFDHNLFEDQTNLKMAAQLLGFAEQKPFECVGTYEEVQVAFYLTIKQYEAKEQVLPPVLEAFKKQLFSQKIDWQRRAQKLLSAWQPAHHLDEKLEQILRSELFSNILHTKFDNKQIAILGLAREGRATYNFMRRHLPEIPIILLDKQPQEKIFSSNDQQFLAKIKSDKNTQLLLAEEHDRFLNSKTGPQTVLFKAPGIPKTLPLIESALKNGAQLYSQTQLFFELCPAKIIGVTGTKGKSTTSAAIHHLLKESAKKTVLVGNIGSPAIESLEDIDSQTLVVYELSCHQLDSLKQSPEIAVVQRITSEHLDYYASTEAYVQAKSSVTRYQTTDDFVIFCNDFDDSTKQIANLSQGKKLAFSLINPLPNQLEVDLSNTKLPGKHNLYNLTPAVIIGQLLGLPNEQISQVLNSFPGLPDRLEHIANYNQVDYYNDSLATMPEAAIKAIESFPDRSITLIAGGYERHQDFSELIKKILNSHVKTLILFPTTGRRLKQQLEETFAEKTMQGIKKVALPKIFEVLSMDEAVKIASVETIAGGVVLMSPASASFGMFIDYRDRAEKFIEAVKKLNV